MTIFGISVYVVMWCLLSVVTSVTMILFCMCFIGLTSEFLLAINNIYVGEIASPKNREFITISYCVLAALGRLTEYIVLSFDNYFALAFTPFLVSLLALASTYWMVESPCYSLSVHLDQEAKDNITVLYRGKTNEFMDQKYTEMKEYVHEQDDDGILKTFIRLDNLKLFLFYCAVYVTSVVSCDTIVLNFGGQIIDHLNIGQIGDLLFMDTGAVIHVVCYIISFLTIRHFNRRVLLLNGFIVSAVIEMLCAFFFFIVERSDYNAPIASYTIVVLLLFFSIQNLLAVQPTLEVLRTEIYSYKLKLFCALFVQVMMDAFNFVQLQTFFPLANVFGQSFNMFIYSLFACTGAILVYKFLRDTKNKSLLQIRQEYNSFQFSEVNATADSPAPPNFVNV